MIFDKKCALQDFLNSQDAPKNFPSALWIDGYVTCVVIGPSLILPSTWLLGILGEDYAFATEEQGREVVAALMRHYDDVCCRLGKGEKYLPIHCSEQGNLPTKEEACEWAKGFLDAIGLNPESWTSLFLDEEAAILLGPVFSFVQKDEEDVDNPEDFFASSIRLLPKCVLLIQDYWTHHEGLDDEDADDEDDDCFQPAVHVNKTGRNEPCPCGSGKKYKRCCGSD